MREDDRLVLFWIMRCRSLSRASDPLMVAVLDQTIAAEVHCCCRSCVNRKRMLRPACLTLTRVVQVLWALFRSLYCKSSGGGDRLGRKSRALILLWWDCNITIVAMVVTIVL